MPRIDILIAIVGELLKTLLVEVVSEHVRTLRRPRRLRGMKEVRKHVHHRTRRHLLNRLSTEIWN